MGSPLSRPPPTYYRVAPSYAPRTYLLPSETLLTCPGGPVDCFCRIAHKRPRFVFLDPTCIGAAGGGRRRRYLDPMQYVERLVVGQQNSYPFAAGGGMGDGFAGMAGGGVNSMPNAGFGYPFDGGGGGGGGGAAYGFGVGGAAFGGGGAAFAGGGMPFPFGGFGGLGWKDPRDWTTRDFDTLSEVLEELVARQWGRRGGRGHHYGGGGDGFDYYGYDRDRDRDGAGGGRREVRDLIALLQQLDTSRRLNGVETTVYGTEAEARESAFRERLYNLFGWGGGEGNDRPGRNDRGDGLNFGGGGGGGGGVGTRFAQQQRDHERREREQRNLDRELDDIRRQLERLRDQGDRGRGRAWIEEWPFR